MSEGQDFYSAEPEVAVDGLIDTSGSALDAVADVGWGYMVDRAEDDAAIVEAAAEAVGEVYEDLSDAASEAYETVTGWME